MAAPRPKGETPGVLAEGSKIEPKVDQTRPGDGAVIPALGPNPDLHLKDNVTCLERLLVHKALERANGTKKEAARLLGISFRRLRRLLRRLERDTNTPAEGEGTSVLCPRTREVRITLEHWKAFKERREKYRPAKSREKRLKSLKLVLDAYPEELQTKGLARVVRSKWIADLTGMSSQTAGRDLKKLGWHPDHPGCGAVFEFKGVTGE